MKKIRQQFVRETRMHRDHLLKYEKYPVKSLEHIGTANQMEKSHKPWYVQKVLPWFAEKWGRPRVAASLVPEKRKNLKIKQSQTEILHIVLCFAYSFYSFLILFRHLTSVEFSCFRNLDVFRWRGRSFCPLRDTGEGWQWLSRSTAARGVA